MGKPWPAERRRKFAAKMRKFSEDRNDDFLPLSSFKAKKARKIKSPAARPLDSDQLSTQLQDYNEVLLRLIQEINTESQRTFQLAFEYERYNLAPSVGIVIRHIAKSIKDSTIPLANLSEEIGKIIKSHRPM